MRINTKKKLCVKHYRKLCQKGSQENYIFDQLIGRKISIYITIPMVWMKIRPNQATFLSLVALVSSFYFFLFNTPIMLVMGITLLLLYYLLDHVDGELARYYSKTESNYVSNQAGHYFDILCHRYSTNVFIFLFGISAYTCFGYEWPVLVAFVTSTCSNRFPELVANKIIINIAANYREKLNEVPVKKLMRILEMKKSQIEGVQASITDPKKWIKLAKEMLGFPGVLIMIMFVSLMDVLFPTFTIFTFEMNYRLLLVVIIFPIELLRTIYRSVGFFRLFKEVVM